MTLQQIRYLIEVHNAGSISRAAENLFVSQSSVSAAIMEVEKEYGITIFERTPKGTCPTSRGQEFLSDIKYVLNYQDYIDSKYGVEKSESKSALSISTLHHVCGDGAYFQFLKENMKEEFRYDYLEASPDEVLGNLSSGRSELGILFCTLSSRNMFFQEIEHKGLIFHHLAYTNAYVYVSSTHPYAKKESVFFSDMASFPFVSYDYQNPNAERYTSAFMQNKQFHKVLHVSDRATAYSVLRTVDAFSIGSGYISADEKYGDIISIPISDCDKIEVGWLSRSNHILSEQAASFIAILERMISVNTEEGEGFQRTDSV